MINKNVLYIYINSYKHTLPYEAMAERYITNSCNNIDKADFLYNFNKLVKKCKKINNENARNDINNEHDTSKNLLLCIKKFLYT